VAFPLPLAPAVIVNQLALLVAVHAQPLVVVTVSVAAPPAAVADGLVGDTVNAHGAANSKVFDSVLTPLPPGPIAVTVASYTMPCDGNELPSKVAKFTVIVLVESGAGFPSDTT
jgi:hypothetical protein